MKLILTSNQGFITKYGYQLLGIPKEKVRVGYVITATTVARDTRFFEVAKKEIAESGYHYEKIDIAGKNEKELRDFFRDKNVIHIEGGNVFYLLKIVRETGFDLLLKEFIIEGKIYIGASAGAYLACPTVEVADWTTNGKSRFELTDFTALHLVPFLLKVHYTDEKKDEVLEHMKNLTYPLRILRDDQGIFVEDNIYTFLGEGKEVILN